MERIADNMTDFSGRYTFNRLLKIYGLSRTVMNGRIKALDIKPSRRGKRLYFNRRQLSLLDDLDAHLKAGGKTEEFVAAAIASKRIVTHAQREIEILKSTIEPNIFESPGSTKIPAEPVEPGTNTETEDDGVAIPVINGKCHKADIMQTLENKLALIYAETEDFTLPGLKEKLEEHRKATKQINKYLSKFSSTDFFWKLQWLDLDFIPA